MVVPVSLAVWPVEAGDVVQARAQLLSEQLQLPLTEGALVLLCVGSDGLWLSDRRSHPAAKLRLDYARHLVQVTRGRKPDLLRAVKAASGVSVVDLTAGFGFDAMVMAQAGCSVVGIEQLDWLVVLLRDALDRLGGDLAVDFRCGDSQLVLGELGGASVVYADPMFLPTGKSAKANKYMDLLQFLDPPVLDERALFQLGVRYARDRFVVKRHCHAGYLADEVPHHQVVGRTIRFDVYRGLA